MILITGGSGSGKSEYAEKIAVQLKKSLLTEKMIYIATMMPLDNETLKKIERHRKMRYGKGFLTEECYCVEDIKKKSEMGYFKESIILIECISNLTANEIFSFKNKNACCDIANTIKNIKSKCMEIIIVTNEVFSDGAKYSFETLEYMKCLGKINCYMAEIADKVIEVVCGVPIYIK